MRLKNIKKEKKGISLVVLLIVIGVMLILLSTITISLDSIVTNSKKRQFAKEIYEIQSMVDTYKKQNDDYPYTKNDEVNETIELNTSDESLELYVLDLRKIEANAISRGYKQKGDNTDVYAFSNTTGKVYYVKGYTVRRETYYTLTDELKKLIGLSSKTSYGSEIIKSEFNINDEYTKYGLVLLLDGIQNTRNGHSDTTTVWEDLSGNNNDFFKLSGSSDATWSENSYVGDGTTNRTLVLNKAILEGATGCTVEVCYDISGLKNYYWIFQNRQKNQPPNGFQFSVGSTSRGVTAFVNNSVFNALTSHIKVTDVNKRTMGFAVDITGITFVDNGNFYTEASKEGVVDSIVERNIYSIGSDYPWESPGNWLLKGNIYSIRVYNRKLSEVELRNNFEVDKKRFNIE